MKVNPMVAVGSLRRALICSASATACWCFSGSVISGGSGAAENAVSAVRSYVPACRLARPAKILYCFHEKMPASTCPSRRSLHRAWIIQSTSRSSCAPSGFHAARTTSARASKACGSSSGSSAFSDRRPWVMAFCATRALPVAVLGPVLRCSFCRFAPMRRILVNGVLLWSRKGIARSAWLMFPGGFSSPHKMVETQRPQLSPLFGAYLKRVGRGGAHLSRKHEGPGSGVDQVVVLTRSVCNAVAAAAAGVPLQAQELRTQPAIVQQLHAA